MDTDEVPTERAWKASASKAFAAISGLIGVVLAGLISWIIAENGQRAALEADAVSARRSAYEQVLSESRRTVSFLRYDLPTIPAQVESYSEGLQLHHRLWGPVETNLAIAVARVEIVGSQAGIQLTQALAERISEVPNSVLQPPGPIGMVGDSSPSSGTTTTTTIDRARLTRTLTDELFDLDALRSGISEVEALREQLISLAREEVGY